MHGEKKSESEGSALMGTYLWIYPELMTCHYSQAELGLQRDLSTEKASSVCKGQRLTDSHPQKITDSLAPPFLTRPWK